MTNYPYERISLACPYCGNTFVASILRDELRPQVVLCDIDETRGCDEYFAVSVRWRPLVEFHLFRDVVGRKNTE